ncbi:MAG: OmpA family protein [Deltaproteobacteria bacterium]|nr:OmpA family protein [Deltaproteobacteria bacterium]
MRTISVIFCCALLGALPACENARFGAREKGALGGAAVGAGLGAIIGNQTGNAGAGVAIGSAIGAISGALIGNEIDSQDAAMDAADERLVRQQQELEENRRLIEELRARGADVRRTDRGVVVNLPDVLFEFDSARVTPEARSTVREISEVVRNASDRRVSVEGHTDSVGTVDYNLRLSRERARSVADELSANGVNKRRITIRGFGESDPIASNKSATGRSRNRRVEVIIENPAR